MLTIRQEQFDAFQPVADDSFARRLAEFLKSRHPRAVVRRPAAQASVVGRLGERELLELVRAGIARARRYGLRNESSLAAFVTLMFLTAPNFDEHPLVRRVLAGDQAPPESKMERLLSNVNADNLRVVKQAYDPDAWRRVEGAGAKV